MLFLSRRGRGVLSSVQQAERMATWALRMCLLQNRTVSSCSQRKQVIVQRNSSAGSYHMVQVDDVGVEDERCAGTG